MTGPSYAFFETLLSDSVIFSNFLLEGNQGSIIYVGSSANVSFTGCAFNNNKCGSTRNGYVNIASFEICQNVLLADSSFSDNIALLGNVLMFNTTTEAAISGCTFNNNVARNDSSIRFQNIVPGVTVTDSIFHNNSGYEGGAVYIAGAENLYVNAEYIYINFNNCSFVGNSALYGGAIYSDTSMSFLKCFFDRNSANLGGAIVSNNGALSVDYCVFSSNTAGTDENIPDASGGAIVMNMIGNFINLIATRIAHSKFIENTARQSGGALAAYNYLNLTIYDCSFIENLAGSNGGAISIRDECSGITIDRTNLTRNIAQLNGGGIYFTTFTQFISVTSSVFTENAALEGSGGAMHFTGTCNRISIGGLQPVKLSADTANNSSPANAGGGIQYAGFVDTSNASGYYVTFDETSVVEEELNYDGIEIFGIDGLVFEGGKYYTPNAFFGALDDKSNYPGFGSQSPIFVNGARLTYKMFVSYSQYNFTVYPIPTRLSANLFTGNTAYLKGGAIYWGNANTDIFVMPGTFFFNNSVTAKGGSGGAVFVDISNTRIHILSSSFVNNAAHTGGAVGLSQSNYPIDFYHCNFTGNHVTGKGGAVYLGDGNGYGFFQVFTISAVRFVNAIFHRNTALSGGGAYISNSNAVTFDNAVMTDNVAKSSGGALCIESKNIVHLNNTELSRNTAQFGGAMKISGINNVTFNNLTHIHKNNASIDGGAISMAQGSVGSALAFEGRTSFISNRAGDNGGAIHSIASTLVLGSKSIIFEGNVAREGSAIRLEAMLSPSVVISPSNTFITFYRNTCTGRGGTVSWIKDSQLSAGIYSANAIRNFNRTVYRNNQAVFGSNSSTQATKLAVVGNSVLLVHLYYSEVLPHPTVHLLDYFSNKDITDNSTLVTASVFKSFCLPRVGYLNGEFSELAVAGDAKFDGLNIFCYPGGNMTLKYTGKSHLNHYHFCFQYLFVSPLLHLLFPAQLQGLDATYNVEVQSTFVFRQCVDGEILVENQCLVCPSGSYSFHYDPLHPTTKCTDCPPFSYDCFGSTILVSPGYWRINKYSIMMSECPHGKAACHGGIRGTSSDAKAIASYVSSNAGSPTTSPIMSVVTIDDSPEGCARGYEGPLCAVCSEKFYYASTSSTCIACEGDGQGQLAALILIPLVILIVVVYFTFTTFLAKAVDKSSLVYGMMGTRPMDNLIEGHVVEVAAVTCRATADQQKDKESNDNGAWERKPSAKENFQEWLSRAMIVMTPKLKIMLTVFQIVSSLPFALDIQFTELSTKLFHAFR